MPGRTADFLSEVVRPGGDRAANKIKFRRNVASGAAGVATLGALGALEEHRRHQLRRSRVQKRYGAQAAIGRRQTEVSKGAGGALKATLSAVKEMPDAARFARMGNKLNSGAMRVATNPKTPKPVTSALAGTSGFVQRNPMTSTAAAAGTIGVAGGMLVPRKPKVSKSFVTSPRGRMRLADKGDALPNGKLPIGGPKQLVAAERRVHQLKTPKERAEGEALIQRKKREFGKRARTFDAEDRRQRRLGAAIAGTAIGGLALTGHGVRGIKTSTLLSRRGARFAPTAGRPAAVLEHEGKKRVILLHEGVLEHAEDLHRHGISARRRDLAEVGGGVGLLGASAALGSHAQNRANRRWR